MHGDQKPNIKNGPRAAVADEWASEPCEEKGEGNSAHHLVHRMPGLGDLLFKKTWAGGRQ